MLQVGRSNVLVGSQFQNTANKIIKETGQVAFFLLFKFYDVWMMRAGSPVSKRRLRDPQFPGSTLNVPTVGSQRSQRRSSLFIRVAPSGHD